MFKDKYSNNVEGLGGCDTTVYQDLDLCVPITVEPYVDLGEPVIECIENPCLVPIHCGEWNKKGKCRFTICQKLSIMIPIEFNVDACSGPVSVNCLGDEEEDECPCPPFVCCEKEECRPPLICKNEEIKRELLDFYYYVGGRRGRLKN